MYCVTTNRCRLNENYYPNFRKCENPSYRQKVMENRGKKKLNFIYEISKLYLY